MVRASEGVDLRQNVSHENKISAQGEESNSIIYSPDVESLGLTQSESLFSHGTP